MEIAVKEGITSLGIPADNSDMAPLLEILGHGNQSPADPETKRRIIVSLLRQLIGARCERAPLVIILEDLHWLDHGSASVLAEIAADLSNLPCLLITTSRPEWEPLWPCLRVDLQPLELVDAQALVARELGWPVAPEVVNAILEKTAGNPLFTQELARSLRESGTLLQRDGVWTVQGAIAPKVPETVHEVLAARLDRLPTGARRTLQAAAVIGRTFWPSVIERVAARPTLSDDLALLAAGSFIELRATAPEPTYAFSHALIQEVTYGTLLHAQRRVDHGKVGAALEELLHDRVEELVDELAFHYGRSDRDEKALYWLMRAGNRASALFANDEALSFYASALERATTLDRPVAASEIQERIADVQALCSFDLARERSAEEQQRAARLLREVGTALAGRGSFPHALQALADAMAVLGDKGENVEQARILLCKGDILIRQGDQAAAREALTRAVEIAEHLGEDEVVADGLSQLRSL